MSKQLYSNYIKLLIFTLLLITSCSKSKFDEALSASEANRCELEKVINHYSKDSADSLKLKAAIFLIENMLYNYHFNNSDIDTYYLKADSIFHENRIHDRYETRLDTLLEYIDKSSLNKTYDLKSITSEQLIANIDEAFESMKYPWCANLSFDDFCEYILPYKTGNSPIDKWRSLYKDKFQHVVDSVMNIGFSDTTVYLQKIYEDVRINQEYSGLDTYTDSIIKNDPLQLIVCRALSRQYWAVIHHPKLFKPEPPPSLLLNMKVATCSEWAQLGVYTMRSFGLPVVRDFTPNWGNRSGGHEWNTLILKDGKSFPFQMGEAHLAGHYNWLYEVGDHDQSWKLPKVYRRTYKIQEQSLIFKNFDEEIPELFKDPYYKDVSDLYFDAVDISIKIDETRLPKNKQLAYIMVFDNQNWQPVHWGQIENGKVTFTKMAKGCAYMVAYFQDRNFHSLSYPFYVNKDGQIINWIPDWNKKQTARLIRKYTDKKVNEWAKRVVGAKFQLANNADFSDATTVYTIDSIPESMYQTITVNLPKKYKYVRYFAPEGCPGDLAEMEVYNSQGELMEGTIIGTNSSLYIYGLSDKYKAFDKDVLTFFEAEQNKNVWTGLQLNKKEQISKILYLPRNDDNFIREDELYELFYWDKDKWNSLGQQKGKKATQELRYEVPGNALFHLKNLSKGKEERIFTYENNKQIWW